MEKLRQTQEGANINFLDPHLVVELVHNPDAVLHYPDITAEDLRTKTERYRILLGKVGKVHGGCVQVSIDAVMELQKGDLPPQLEIEEGHKGINFNLKAVKKYFELLKLKSSDQELAELNFIGEMHTHPLMPHEFTNGKKPWEPSQGPQSDVEGIIKSYKNGTLDKTKPFIFSIAGPDDDRKTKYAFYRLVFKDGNYEVQLL
ncbi:MAG: hypothetical protein NTZ87_04055 [Candidatus Nomurabacteria bacterium]|nr:hypothetical protein [Candidatus Nomurabacteria bacterium]